MRRRTRLTTTRPGSPNRYCNFSVHGHRFRASLGTDDEATAEILAAKIRSDALLGSIVGRKAEITLTQALGRYWIERGQYAATADEIKRHGRTLMEALGAGVLLSGLSYGALSSYVASRRVRKVRAKRICTHNCTTSAARCRICSAVVPTKPKWVLADRANGSVNREIGHLRTVMLAADRWGMSVAKIDWRALVLDEPENVQTILSADKEDELLAALRVDFHPLVQFALLTGVRLENAIGLTWPQIDWDARTITFRTKSRKPGGALHVLPLTGAIAAVVSRERGNHRDFVFTYVCARNRHDPHTGAMQRKGERYPFTHDGWRKAWHAARLAVEMPRLRFHDLRHTAATRALGAHRNLKTVQRMLGHADIATTLRYVASDVADVRAAMEAVEQQARLKTVFPKKAID